MHFNAPYPAGTHDASAGVESTSCGMTLFLTRHSGLDRTCRVRFNLRVGGDGDGGGDVVESGLKDEWSDADGKSYGWLPRAKMTDLVDRGNLRIVAEMTSVNVVSHGPVICNCLRRRTGERWEKYSPKRNLRYLCVVAWANMPKNWPYILNKYAKTCICCFSKDTFQFLTFFTTTFRITTALKTFYIYINIVQWITLI